MARELDCAPALVVKQRRAGMPMTSADAARAWRAEHVRPRFKPPPADVAGPVAAGGADALAVAIALGAAADARLQAGEDIGDMVPALRAALRVLPTQRGPLPYSLRVMALLTAEARALALAGMSPGEIEAEQQRAAAMPEAEAAEVGVFLVEIACGRFVIQS